MKSNEMSGLVKWLAMKHASHVVNIIKTVKELEGLFPNQNENQNESQTESQKGQGKVKEPAIEKSKEGEKDSKPETANEESKESNGKGKKPSENAILKSDLSSIEGQGQASVSGRPLNKRLNTLNKIGVNYNLEFIKNVISHFQEFKSRLESDNYDSNVEGQSAIKRINFGDDVSNLLSSELVLLANRKTANLFAQKLANASLLIKKPIEKFRAPIVISIDQSGSMYGVPYEMACGFALAMLAILKEQQRKCIIIKFNTSVNEVIDCDNVSLTSILEVLGTFDSGGTNFDVPIRRMFDLKKEYEWEHLVGILVTDGDCYINSQSELMNLKSHRDKLVAVVIGRGGVSHLAPVIDESAIVSRRDMFLELVKVGMKVL
jgi:uncharacterized protein with von Willebrand factor type A (vWA) domain